MCTPVHISLVICVGGTHITSDMCTPSNMAAVLCVSPLVSAANYLVKLRVSIIVN